MQNSYVLVLLHEERNLDCMYSNRSESFLIYLICVYLRIVVFNTYCVVFLFWLPLSCVPYFASFSGLSIFDCPFGVL